MNNLYARACASIATWFGVGLWRGPTGTWGSAAALPLCALLYIIGGTYAMLLVATLLLVVGIVASSHYATSVQQADPKAVVVDEVVGQMLALAWVSPSWLWYGVGFALFRAADIVKPWPACYIDKHWPSGYGIMADDVVAGAYAAIVVAFLKHGATA